MTRQRADEVDRLNCHGPVVMNGKNANLFLTHDNFETLRTRSLSIILDKKPIGYEVTRFNPELHDARLVGLMHRLKRWGVVNTRAICSIDVDPLIPARIDNRPRELWTVLFRVAHHLQGAWPARCEAAARAFTLGEWPDDETPCVGPTEELLYCVRAAFDDEETFVSTADLLYRLGAASQRPTLMVEWHTERAATMGLASGLAVYGIEAARGYVDGTQVRGYARDDVFESETVETNA